MVRAGRLCAQDRAQRAFLKCREGRAYLWLPSDLSHKQKCRRMGWFRFPRALVPYTAFHFISPVANLSLPDLFGPIQGKWPSENRSYVGVHPCGTSTWSLRRGCSSPKELLCPRDKQFPPTWLQRATVGRRGISLREATKRYVLIKSLPNTEIMWVRQRKKGGDKREKGKDVFTYFWGEESTL